MSTIYTQRHYVGFAVELAKWKQDIEAALPTVGGFWMLPALGEAPTSLVADDSIAMFSVCVTPETVLPPVPSYVLQFDDGVLDRFEGVLAVAIRRMPTALAANIPAKPATWSGAVRAAARTALLAAASKVCDDLEAVRVVDTVESVEVKA